MSITPIGGIVPTEPSSKLTSSKPTSKEDSTLALCNAILDTYMGISAKDDSLKALAERLKEVGNSRKAGQKSSEIEMIAGRLLKTDKEEDPNLLLPKITPLEGVPRVDEILLAHFFGDAFMENAECNGVKLEGFLAFDLTTFVSKFLEKSLPIKGLGASMDLFPINPLMKHVDLTKLQQSIRAIKAGQTLAELTEFLKGTSPEYAVYDAEQYRDALREQLEKNGRVLLQSGWIKPSGGHTIYLLIEKTGLHYNVTAYNRGEGVQFHLSPELLVRRGYKELYPPGLRIEDVKPENLFDLAWIRSLMEINTVNQRIDESSLTGDKTLITQRSTCYSQMDFYGYLLPQLGGHAVPSACKTDEFVTTQSSGTCSLASLEGFQRSDLGYESFKAITLMLKRYVFWSYWKEHEEIIANNTERYALFTQCMEQYHVKLQEAAEIGLITKGACSKEMDALQALRTRLEIERNRQIGHIWRTTEASFHAKTAWNSGEFTAKVAPILGEMVDSLPAQANLASKITTAGGDSALPPPAGLSKTLDELNRAVSQCYGLKTEDMMTGERFDPIKTWSHIKIPVRTSSEARVVLTALDDWIKKLPLPSADPSVDDNYWVQAAKMDPEIVRKLFYQLRELQGLYAIGQQLRLGTCDSVSVLSFYKLIAINDRLLSLNARALGVDELINPPYFGYLSACLGDPGIKHNQVIGFHVTDPIAHKQLEDVHAYFRERQKSVQENYLLFYRDKSSQTYLGEKNDMELLSPEVRMVQRLLSNQEIASQAEFQLPLKCHISQKAECFLDSQYELNRVIPDVFTAWQEQNHELFFFVDYPPGGSMSNCYIWRGKSSKAGPGEKHEIRLLSESQTQAQNFMTLVPYKQGSSGEKMNSTGRVYNLRAPSPYSEAGHCLEAVKRRRGMIEEVEISRASRDGNDLIFCGDKLKDYFLSGNIQSFRKFISLGISGLQAVNVLGFISDRNNFADLTNTDLQSYLMHLLLEGTELSRLNKESPAALIQAFKGIKDAYLFHKDNGNIQACCYLLTMQRYLNGFWESGSASQDQRREASIGSLNHEKELNSLIDLSHMEEEERSVCYQEWLASHPVELDAEKILQAYSHIASHAVRSSWRDPELETQVANHMLRCGTFLDEVLQKEPSLLSKIFAKSIPQTMQWKFNPKTGRAQTEAGDYQFDLTTGLLLSPGRWDDKLPRDILEHPLYRKVVGKTLKCRQLSPNNWLVETEGGQSLTISKNGYELFFTCEVSGRRYQWLPASSLPFPNPWFQSLDHWITIDEKFPKLLHSMDKQGNLRAVSHLTSTGQGICISKTALSGKEDALLLSRLKSNDPLVELISPFEPDYNWILAWQGTENESGNSPGPIQDQPTSAGKGRPERIELPRFGLSFKQQEGQWFCEQFKGYHLKPEQNCIPLERLGIKEYLQLRNEEGMEKILIPAWKLMEPVNFDEPIGKRGYPLMVETEGSSQTYVEMEFNPTVLGSERELIPKDEACLHLAMMALASASTEGYEVAAKLLSASNIPTASTNEKRAQLVGLLKNIAMMWIYNGDQHPRAAAIRLQAHYLYLTQLAKLPRGPDAERHKPPRAYRELLKKDLLNYVHLIKHNKSYRIPGYAYVFLCKRTAPIELDLLEYLKVIDSETAKKLDSAKPSFDFLKTLTPDITFTPSLQNDLRTGLKYFYDAKPEFLEEAAKKGLLTRPGSNIFALFYYYLPAAVKGKPAPKTLHDFFAATRYDPDPMVRIVRALLMMFLEERFRAPETRDQLLQNDWLENTIKMALSYANKKEIPFLAADIIEGPSSSPSTQKMPRKDIGIPDDSSPRAGGSPFPPALRTPEMAFVSGGGYEFRLNDYLLEIPPPVVPLDNISETTLKLLHNEVFQKGNTPKLFEQEAERLRKGCELHIEKARNVPPSEARLDPDKIVQLRTKLEKLDQILQGDVIQQQAELIEMFTMSADSSQKGRRIEKPKSIDDIILMLARNEINDKTLKELAVRFLVTATYRQKIARGLGRLKEYGDLKGGSDAERRLLLDLAYGELTAKRIFDPSTRPELLALEFWNNLRIWPAQDSTIKTMLKGEGHLVVQRMMGIGKTSIIAPTLLFFLADGKRLACFGAPEQLLDSSIGDEVRQRIARFDQLTYKKSWTRDSNYSVAALKEELSRWKGLVEERGVLMMSPKSYDCLYLKFLELWSEASHGGSEKKRQLVAIRKLLNMAIENAFFLFDEFDLSASHKEEVQFPAGSKQQLPDEEIDAMLALHDLFFEDPKISSMVKLSFDPQASGSEVFSTDLWEGRLRQALQDALMDKMRNEPGLISPIPKIQKELGALLNDKDKNEKIRLYLAQEGTPKQLEELDKFVAQIPEKEVRNILALYKEELQHLLKNTLGQTCDMHFGGDSAAGYVIPYRLGRPEKGADFTNPYEAANNNIANFRKHPIPQQFIRAEMESLKAQCTTELSLGMRLEDTNAYRKFCGLLGDRAKDFSLPRLTEDQIRNVAGIVNSTWSGRKYFLRHHILRQVGFYTQKWNANAQMLSPKWFMQKLLAFSGTVANKQGYPEELTVLSEDAVDGQSLLALAERMDPVPLKIVKEDSVSILKILLHKLNDGQPMRALIDVGGFLNDSDPYQVAAEWLPQLFKYGMEAIVYSDREGRLVSLEKGQSTAIPLSQSTIPKEKRFTIYRQAYTTGVDIPQSLEAHALMTFGRSTTIRDSAQGLYRMRRIETSQRGSWLVAADVEKLIRAKQSIPENQLLNSNHLLRFALINQSLLIEEGNAASALLKIRAMVQHEIITVVMKKELTGEQIASLYTAEMEDIFSPKIAGEAHALFGLSSKAKPAKEVLEDEIQRCLKLLENVCKDNPLLKEIDLKRVGTNLHKLINAELLPDTMPSVQGEGLGKRCMVQQQVQMAALTQTQSLSMPICAGSMFMANWGNDNPYSAEFNALRPNEESPEGEGAGFLNLKDVVGMDQSCNALESALDERIQATSNFCNIVTIGDKYYSKPFDSGQKNCHYLLIRINKETGEQIIHILSQHDARHFKKKLLSNTPAGQYQACLYNLDLGIVYNGKDPVPQEALQDPRLRSMLAQVYFFAGKIPDDKNLQKALADWLKKNNGAALLKIYKDKICPLYPDALRLLPRLEEMAGLDVLKKAGMTLTSKPKPSEIQEPQPAKFTIGPKTQSPTKEPLKIGSKKNDKPQVHSSTEEVVNSWTATPESKQRMLVFLKTYPETAREFYFLASRERNILLDDLSKAIVNDSIQQQIEEARNHSITLSEMFLKQHLNHYKLDHCASDGNCLYEALGKSLRIDKLQLRKEVAAYMRLNKVELQKIVSLDLDVSDGEYERLVKCVESEATLSENTSGWGEMRHAYIIARAYEIPVNLHSHIFRNENGTYRVELLDPTSSKKEPIDLFYNGASHWDRLISQKDRGTSDMLKIPGGTETSRPPSSEPSPEKREDVIKPASNLPNVPIGVSEVFLKQQLAGFRLDRCAADGNSLYEAVAKYMESNIVSVRGYLATYMRDAKAKLQKIENLQLNVGDDEYERLVQSIANDVSGSMKDSGPGETFYANLIAYAFKIPVNLHSHIFHNDTGNYGVKSLNPEQSKMEPLELFFNGTNHWDRLIPKK